MENGAVKKEIFGISDARFHGDEFTPAKAGVLCADTALQHLMFVENSPERSGPWCAAKARSFFNFFIGGLLCAGK
jgi:hypothetical protein